MQDALPLRDIHLPPPPAAWPPAPGWWLLGAVLLVLAAYGARRMRAHWRRRRLRAERLRVFDAAVAAADDASARLATISQLLRRAARTGAGAHSASLAGEEWLRFLDGDDPARPFSTGAGSVLREGPFRAPSDPQAAPQSALIEIEALARRRFLQLLEADHA